jgi:hypothetical protein
MLPRGGSTSCYDYEDKPAFTSPPTTSPQIQEHEKKARTITATGPVGSKSPGEETAAKAGEGHEEAGKTAYDPRFPFSIPRRMDYRGFGRGINQYTAQNPNRVEMGRRKGTAPGILCLPKSDLLSPARRALASRRVRGEERVLVLSDVCFSSFSPLAFEGEIAKYGSVASLLFFSTAVT